MQLSVVVPVKDEVENVKPLLDEIHAALDARYEFEIIYVDDGSSDGTLEVLRHQMLADPRLRVLRHEQGRGQSTAVWSGVHAATGLVIATLDGDGQNDPADIPALVEVLLGRRPDNLQLVMGHRTRRKDSFARRAASRIANRVRRALLGDDTPDTGCGIKVFWREAFITLPYFDHMHRFLPALVCRQGGAVRCTPVNHRPRESGRSKYGIHDRLWAGIADLAGVAWLLRRERRAAVIEEARPALMQRTPEERAAHTHQEPSCLTGN